MLINSSQRSKNLIWWVMERNRNCIPYALGIVEFALIVATEKLWFPRCTDFLTIMAATSLSSIARQSFMHIKTPSMKHLEWFQLNLLLPDTVTNWPWGPGAGPPAVDHSVKNSETTTGTSSLHQKANALPELLSCISHSGGQFWASYTVMLF